VKLRHRVAEHGAGAPTNVREVRELLDEIQEAIADVRAWAKTIEDDTGERFL